MGKVDDNFYEGELVKRIFVILLCGGIFSVRAVTFIRQEDIPYTVSAPGAYRLATNLVATATFTVITIDADDVVLNLGGRVIADRSGVAFGQAIVVDSHSNITIENGTIGGDPRMEIRLTNVNGFRVAEVGLSGSLILDTCSSGTAELIEGAYGCQDAIISVTNCSNVLLEGCSCALNETHAGIQICASNNVTCHGCSAVRNTDGLTLDGCADAEVSEFEAVQNTANGINVMDLTVTCSVHNNFMTANGGFAILNTSTQPNTFCRNLGIGNNDGGDNYSDVPNVVLGVVVPDASIDNYSDTGA